MRGAGWNRRELSSSGKEAELSDDGVADLTTGRLTTSSAHSMCLHDKVLARRVETIKVVATAHDDRPNA